MDNNHRIEPVASDIQVEETETEVGEPKSKLKLQEFELELLGRPETKYHFSGTDFDAFEKEFETKNEKVLNVVIEKAIDGGELSEEEKGMVQRELMRRQLARIWPDVTSFVAKLKGKDGDTAELVEEAMKKGKPEMLAYMLLQLALHSETQEDGKAEVQLAGGLKLYEFNEKMKGKSVKDTGPESEKMAVTALRMFEVFGSGKLNLNDDSIKEMSPEKMLRYALGLK